LRALEHRPRLNHRDAEAKRRSDAASWARRCRTDFGRPLCEPPQQGAKGGAAQLARVHALSHSLSIVLPIYNAQSTLPRVIAELLDTAAELTTRFEIVLVDDGSTDHTEETARELSAVFPQLRVVRLPQRMGVAAAVERGLAEAEGDIILVMDDRGSLRVGDLRRLWELRHDEGLVSARATAPANIEPHRLKRVGAWGAAARQLAAEQDRHGGMQMIRRRAIAELAAGVDADLAVSEIRRTDRINRRSRPSRPTFLAHLKQLALGE
jgi:glycosyltransferase involved in cell wall biosynthesis